MTQRRAIGEILKELGRIDEADIERALEYQRREGGLFGEALIALGLLEPETLEWSLANQFDLPYIFPDADAIDSSVAALVTMEWALRHNALPIMREEQRLTLVVDSPMQLEAPAELASMTGCEVDLALATPQAIRRLIRDVFWKNQRQRMSLANTDAIGVEQLLDRVIRAGYHLWGISERSDRIIGWYHDGSHQTRLRLSGDWQRTMEQRLDSGLASHIKNTGRQVWKAHLDGRPETTEITAIVTAGALELVARADSESLKEPDRLPSMELLIELRQALSDGVMVVGVEQPDDEWALKVLTGIPEQVLPNGHRALFMSAEESELTTGLPVMPVSALQSEADLLRQFAFDALVIEQLPSESDGLAQAMMLSPLLIVGMPSEGGGAALPDEIDALLSYYPDDGESGGWSLRLRHQPAENPTD
jgi:type IV pilus assembly protein PilB